MDFLVASSLCLAGCISNAVLTEYWVTLSHRHSQCGYFGSVIAFAQFLFVVLQGLRSQMHRKRIVSFSKYFQFVILLFVMAICNNSAYHYHVNVPLHQTIRSAALGLTLAINALVLKTRYSIGQVLSVVTVTIGVLFVTLADRSSKILNGEEVLFEWNIGVAMVSVAVLATAVLGALQEHTYHKYSEQVASQVPSDDASAVLSAKRRARTEIGEEGLFYNHLFSLPLFLTTQQSLFSAYVSCTKCTCSLPSLPSLSSVSLNASSIAQFVQSVYAESKNSNAWRIGNGNDASQGGEESQDEWFFPILPLLLGGVVVTHFLCIWSIHKVHVLSGPVTATLITTVRKSITILLSVYLFNSSFTLYHWIGSGLVAVGTVWYALAPPPPPLPCREVQKKKKEM